MSASPPETQGNAVSACWKVIGVWGNNSCPALREAVHCRNCEVFSASASALLDLELPAEYLDSWTEYYATAKPPLETDLISLLRFRIGPEWFAISWEALVEICEWRTIHSLPQAKPFVLGVTNVRGTLLTAISLPHILGLPAITFGNAKEARQPERLIVARHACRPFVFPVSEIGGMQRLSRSSFRSPPVTIANADVSFTKAIVETEGKVAALLDHELLFYSIQKQLA